MAKCMLPSGLCTWAGAGPPPLPPRPPRPPAGASPPGPAYFVASGAAGFSTTHEAPPAWKRSSPPPSHTRPFTDAPDSLTRLAAALPSQGTSQASLVVPFVSSTRALPVNATYLPSGESVTPPIVLIR